MTIPTYMGLNTALSGLEAAQAAINTTGQNIANASTPGYSRQTVNLTERAQLTIPALSSVTGDGSQFGTGVDITSITRIRDQFLDSQYRAQNTTENGNNTSSTILSQVQAGLNEPSSTGLSSALDKLFGDWSTLAGGVSDQGLQTAVMGDGAAVADSLNTLSQQMSTLESQVTQQYNTLTDPTTGAVANDANEIAQLNGQIAQAQSAGINANSLMDQRDNVIDDLSQYSNVNVTAQPNGMVNVSFGNAATAAQGGTADPTPLVNGTSVDESDNLTDANIKGSGGTLGSLLGLYDSTTGTGQIADYVNSLNDVANKLVTTVNNAIATADPNGATATPFFDPSGTTAATIAVNPSLSSNGSTPPYTAAEATAVSALSGGTAQQAYNAFVTGVGSDVQSAQNAQQTSNSLLTAIGNQRQSISGVSLDEEMTNLIQFQQAYQASARVMSTINDTISSLLNMVASG